MRAGDSLPNFPSRVREYTNFCTRGITKMCREIGPRPCGGDAERKAQEAVKKELSTCADTVSLEEFSVRPKSFFAWTYLTGILFPVGVVCFFFVPVVSILCVAVTVAVLFGEFLFYREFVDFLFPKKTSCNVYATRKASGETKKHIIFGGHIDSSYEWTYTHLGGKPLLFGGLIAAAVGLGVLLIAAIISLATDGQSLFGEVLGYISIAFCIPALGLIFFINYKLPVDGANDNLTGVFTSMAILKFMGDNNIRFENTDVSVLSTGGEEAGLRGAKAFAKAHAAEFKDVETVFVGVDTVKDYESMFVYKNDMSGLVKHDIRMRSLVKKAGSFAGMNLSDGNLYCGASDAAAMTQAGVPSTLFAAMDPGPPRYYHTRDDKADILDRKCIEKGVEILLETAFLYDEQGI